MNSYTLVFTENADIYNLNKQLQFFSESNIVKVNSQENFSALDYAIKEAARLGYDSFNFITSNENWAQLDETIQEEYGHLFIETRVIPAIFKRKFNEDTQVSNRPQLVRNAQEIADFINANKKIAPKVITIVPFNLLTFNQGTDSAIVDNIISELEKLGEEVVGKVGSSWKKLYAQARYFPIIPSSDMIIYGGAQGGITADEAVSIAKTFSTKNQMFKGLFEDAKLLGADADGGNVNQQNSINVENKLSDQNYVDSLLMKLKLFEQKTAENPNPKEPVLFIVEQDVAKNVFEKAVTNGNRNVYYYVIQNTKPAHFTSNQDFLNNFNQAYQNIKPANQLAADEIEKLKNQKYSGADFDKVDDYLFQILVVNNWNIQNHVQVDARQFNTNIIQNISIQQGWQSIGDMVSKGLLLDQFQQEFSGTQGEWAIKGAKHLAKMATNAGGYRDEKLKKRANMVGALTPDIAKIPHPTQQKYYKLEDKTLTQEQYSQLPKSKREKAIQIGFQDLDRDMQKKLLDDYTQRVNSASSWFKNAAQKTINSKISGDRQNQWLSTQAQQQADNTSRDEKIEQLKKIAGTCQAQLKSPSLPDNRKEQIKGLEGLATRLITQLQSTNPTDTQESPESGYNLTIYNQTMELAQKLGFTTSNIDNQKVRPDIQSKNELANKQWDALSESEKTQLLLYNQFRNTQNYNKLRTLLGGKAREAIPAPSNQAQPTN